MGIRTHPRPRIRTWGTRVRGGISVGFRAFVREKQILRLRAFSTWLWMTIEGRRIPRPRIRTWGTRVRGGISVRVRGGVSLGSPTFGCAKDGAPKFVQACVS